MAIQSKSKLVLWMYGITAILLLILGVIDEEDVEITVHDTYFIFPLSHCFFVLFGLFIKRMSCGINS